MQISTFQKIQSKLFNLTLLPLTFIVAIVIFFWQSLWDEHFLLATIVFAISFIAFFYFATVNIIQKPLSFLIKMYRDNKKYKTIHKLNPETQSLGKQGINPETTQSEESFTLPIPQLLNRTQSQKQSMHISFNHESEKQIEKINPPLITHQVSNKKPQKGTISSQINEPKVSQVLAHQKNNSNQNANDVANLFTFTNQKIQPHSPERKAFSPKKDELHYMDEFTDDEESQTLRKHIQEIVGTQQNMEDEIRRKYEERYLKYKKSLEDFQLDKEFMERFVGETKVVVKQKIQEHLKKQFENLDSIESILRKNFDANFKSYKERSSELGSKSIYGFGFGIMQGYGGVTQDRSPFNTKQGFGTQNLGKQIKFRQVLQECVNLMHTNYFDFEYVGEPGRMNEIKNELKLLIKQRIELDKFLYLRKSLDVGRNSPTNDRQQQQIICEYQEQRYMIILKLQALVNILNQRQAAQQNLLKQFFSKHHSSSGQLIEQINDERNIEILMNFFVRTLREKLTDSGNQDWIKAQLSRPNFENSSANLIWIKKENSARSHYDIIYSVRREQLKNEKMQEKVVTKDHKKQNIQLAVHCCPGETNIWTCISFVRLLISKIGLKKEEFGMIKDKQLRKDFQRTLQLLR